MVADYIFCDSSECGAKKHSTFLCGEEELHAFVEVVVEGLPVVQLGVFGRPVTVCISTVSPEATRSTAGKDAQNRPARTVTISGI